MVIYEAVRHETDTHDFKSKTEFNVQAKIPFPSNLDTPSNFLRDLTKMKIINYTT